MSSRLKIGVVGTGMVSQIAHLPALAQSEKAQLIAVADSDRVRAEKVARRFGAAQVYGCHKELLKNPEIEAVVVVTHRQLTAAIVRDVLESGRHVLSEKPMAMTLREARELVEIAGRRGLVYAVGFMKRYDAGVLRARLLLQDLASTSRLGRIIAIRGKNFCAEYVGHFDDYELPTPGRIRRQIPAWSGYGLPPAATAKYDWIANVGLHTFNLLQFLMPGSLRLRYAELGFDRAATVLMESGGIPVTIDFGYSAPGRWEEVFEFFFERGRLELRLTSLKQVGRHASITLDENANEFRGAEFDGAGLGPWSFFRQMDAFIDAVRGREGDFYTAGKDCLGDMELLHGIVGFSNLSNDLP